MKKRIICFLIIIATLLSLTSCFRKDVKYDYNMEKYITLPDYKSFKVNIEGNSIQQAIDTYIIQYSKEYTVSRGDKINIEITAYEEDFISEGVDQKGDKIDEISNNDLWITIGSGELSYQIENGLIGKKIDTVVSDKYSLGKDFYNEKYFDKTIFFDVKIKNVVSSLGDIVNVSYTGYYVDENGEILKENGKDKTFDSNENAYFYLGAKLAIDDFEKGLEGMKIGDERNINATFPSTYQPDPTLANKKVLYKVKLLGLRNASVYDNSFIKANFPEYNNTVDFEEALKREYVLSKVYEYIAEKCTVLKYPNAEYRASEAELKEIEESFETKYKVSLDEYLKNNYGMTRDEYIKSNMKSEMIFYAIAQKEGLEPTSEMLKNEESDLIVFYQQYYMQQEGKTEASALATAQEFVSSLGQAYIKENVMFEMVDDMIGNITKVTETPKDYVSITETIADEYAPKTE